VFSRRARSRALPAAEARSLVEVAFYADRAEAQIALGSVQAAGLAAALVTVRGREPRRRVLGYSLRVASGERELAAQLIATDWSAEAWAASGFDPAEERCARCGSSSWVATELPWWSQLAAAMGRHARGQRCCAQCGARET
jgi:hypothetical protein